MTKNSGEEGNIKQFLPKEKRDYNRYFFLISSPFIYKTIRIMGFQMSGIQIM